ncbi:MAG: O-antigen ligase [Aureispira sp.]|jgi:O-antigen ligase
MASKLQLFLAEYPREKLIYASCISLFISLICSKFLLTLSMIALVVFGVLSPTLKQDWKRIWANKSFVATLGIFMLFLGSALVSDNWSESVTRIRIALPMLLLPIAFALLPIFSKKSYQQLLSIYIYMMAAACLGVLINYGLHFEEMQQLLVVSKSIPTPNGEHIRFSLMINLAVFAGFWLLEQQFYWKKAVEKWLLRMVVLFLIITIHLLSVRIGILILYGGLVTTVFYYMLSKKYYAIGIVLLMGIGAMPYMAYKYVPSVQAKVSLTKHNWDMYQQGHIGEYSDTRRLLSYQIAWDVVRESPWFGVGIGDLSDEQKRYYQERYPDQEVMYPHNFFLTLYAATGILGLLFFLGCFFFPLFYRQNYKNLFFLLFYTTIFLSFMTENTLLSALGVGIYSFFLLFSVNYLEGVYSEKEKIKR